MSSYDLVVVGCGPAGAAAAITGARAGANVLLLEKSALPRHKVCGEFISAESLKLLKSLLANSPETRFLLQTARPISGARAFLDGRTLNFPIDPPAASLSRYDLDLALCKAANAAGAQCENGVQVNGIEGAGPFRIATSSGPIETRSLVNASGRWSNLTAQRSLLETAEKWVGVKRYYVDADPAPSTDLYFLKGGYCGIQPVTCDGDSTGTLVNVAAMVKAGMASNIEEVLALDDRLQDRRRKWKPASDPLSTSPLIFRTPQPQRDGVLLVGDAAGFVDPFVGDGISLALRSGVMAAESLVPFFRGERALPDSLHDYSEKYTRHLRPIFRASARLRKFLQLPSAVRWPLGGMVKAIPGLSEFVVRATR